MTIMVCLSSIWSWLVCLFTKPGCIDIKICTICSVSVYSDIAHEGLGMPRVGTRFVSARAAPPGQRLTIKRAITTGYLVLCARFAEIRTTCATYCAYSWVTRPFATSKRPWKSCESYSCWRPQQQLPTVMRLLGTGSSFLTVSAKLADV